MPRSWTTWQICQHRLAMLAAAGLGLTSVASANPLGNAALVDDAALDQMRGGFVLPNGMDITVGIQIDTRVDGQLALRTVLTLGEGGKPAVSVFANQPAAPVAPVISTPVVATPATPVFATPATPEIPAPVTPITATPAPPAVAPLAAPVSAPALAGNVATTPSIPAADPVPIPAPVEAPSIPASAPPASNVEVASAPLVSSALVADMATAPTPAAVTMPVEAVVAAPSINVETAPAPVAEIPATAPMVPLPAPPQLAIIEPAAPTLPIPEVVVANTAPPELLVEAPTAPPPVVEASSTASVMEQVQLALQANGAAIATSLGSVRVEQSDGGSIVILTSPSLELQHLIGAATGVLIANTADNRVIETVATVSVQLSDSAVPIGNTLLRIEAIALDAAGRGIY